MRTFFSKYWSYALTVGVFVISGFLSYVAYTFIVSGSAEYVFEEVSTNIVACIEKNSIECGADTTDYFSEANKSTADNIFKPTQKKDEKYIKWVDFKISLEALNQAYNYDVKSWSAHKTENKPKLCWIELLAYSAAKTGNNFRGTKCKHISAFAKAINDGVVGSAKSEQGGQGEQVKKGENYPNENTAFPPTKESVVKELTKDLKFYNYYHKAFSAVLENFLGEYHCVRDNKTEYGLLVYHPIAKGYGYSSARDFGNARAFGFKRKHLGNDFFGRTGTPIIAVEGGTIHEAGWNRYGGWRIGILSHCKKRYYYYAHLRKDKPFYKDYKRGDKVNAGDIIGYLGNTGYSYKPNRNMASNPHLHYGLQLVFHPSQFDTDERQSKNEIWIDNYNLIRFLQKNRMQVKTENDKLIAQHTRKPISE